MLALDIVSATLGEAEDVSIALNESELYVRFNTMYNLFGVKGTFVNVVKNMMLEEGRRRMYCKQRLHIRQAATTSSDSIVVGDVN